MISGEQVNLPGREGVCGRSGVDNRLFVTRSWMAGNVARWGDMPKVFGKWTGVHARFRRWSHAGVWERLSMAWPSYSAALPPDITGAPFASTASITRRCHDLATINPDTA